MLDLKILQLVLQKSNTLKAKNLAKQLKRMNLANVSSTSQHDNSKQPQEPAAQEIEVQDNTVLEGEHRLKHQSASTFTATQELVETKMVSEL